VGKQIQRKPAIGRLLEKKLVLEITVEGLKDPFYIKTADFERYVDSGDNSDSGTEDALRFLTPLDNLIWDREATEDLFGFRHRWEIYKPAVGTRHSSN